MMSSAIDHDQGREQHQQQQQEEQHIDITQSRYLLATDYAVRFEQYHRHIIIGSISRRLDEPQDNRWTHQFRVYVKSEEVSDDDDVQLADFVQRVVFRFSDECANCISIVDGPPYQSNSFCSQDLHITLTLLFRDVNHSCTIFHHELKLQSFDALGREQPCVLSEQLQTISFINPSKRMMKMLKLRTRLDKPQPDNEDISPTDLAAKRLQRSLKWARKMVNKQRKYLVHPPQCLNF